MDTIDTVSKSRIITIDRTQLFDPVKFLGEGWSIEKQDEHSLALTQVDLANVQLIKPLLAPVDVANEQLLRRHGDWYCIKDCDEIERLKKIGYVRLDAKIFQALWENKELIPESWKKETNGDTTYIHFDGTVFSFRNGPLYTFFLCWDWHGYWRPGAITGDRMNGTVSACLPKNLVF